MINTVHSLVMALLLMVALLMLSANSQSGEADVLDIKVRHNGGDSFQIITEVQHGDTGWDHYANVWQVLDEQGKLLGTRTLYHPHVKEQPFTRSLTLSIPTHVKTITVRAGDSVHGFGGKERTVELLRDKK